MHGTHRRFQTRPAPVSVVGHCRKVIPHRFKHGLDEPVGLSRSRSAETQLTEGLGLVVRVGIV
jgi:hypothetical protein